MSKRSTTIRDRHRRQIAKGRPPCSSPDCLFPDEPIDYDTDDHMDPLAYVVDHVIPLARGGPDTLANKAAMHRACNLRKADRLPGEMDSRRQFETERTW